MKFSIATTVLFASGIAAMPWSFANSKHPESEEITLRIKVSQPSSKHAWSRKGKGVANANIFCTPGCKSEWPECPDGYDPADPSEDPCWSCCNSPF